VRREHRDDVLIAIESGRDATLVRRLWGFILPYRGVFAACVLLLPLASAVSLLQPHLVQLAIDRHFVTGRSEGLGILALFFAGTIVLEFGVRCGQIYLMQLAGQRALRDLRCAVFSHVQRLRISYFHKNPVGRLMTRLTTDVDSLEEALSSGVVTIVGDVFTLAAIVAILLAKNWRLALVTFAVVPLLFLISVAFRVLMRRAYRVLRVKIARLNADLQEAVTGMEVVQLFGYEERSRREYDGVNADHRDAAYAAIRWDAILYAFVEMMGSIAIAGIIWWGAGEAIEGYATLGVLVAFVEYVQKFFVPIRDLSQKYALVQSAMASSERLFGLLDTDEIIPESQDPLPLTAVQTSIEFRNVWFTYTDESNWVLRDVSFSIASGEKVAFCGHTGAGKTTVIGLLTRMYDVQRGEILIDGVDIRRFRLDDLRRLFSVVLQDGFLFAGTLRDNVALRADEISEQCVEEAVRVVHLDQLVSRYPDGLDHTVRERGVNLSSGERQLVTFARALAHRPNVLILDEATANVDSETESLIQDATAVMLARQTSVVIAHRLSTIERVDKIVVLHRGRVAEMGSHRDLVSRGGLYARLVELQYSRLSVHHGSSETNEHG
jgi:ATP-binding cassette subfamily B protein